MYIYSGYLFMRNNILRVTKGIVSKNDSGTVRKQLNNDLTQ